MVEFTFRENPDDLHCVQCAVGMALQAVTGEDLSPEELEQITGFMPGLETWPFASFLALADRGLTVVDVESFDADLFVRDPRAALMRQANDASVVDRIFEVSDVARQVELVRACIASPRVSFVERIPSFDEMTAALARGAMLLVNVNTRILHGSEGYAGHVVFVHGYRDGQLDVEDPGPPSQAGARIDAETFGRAWRSPTEGMANYIAISKKPIVPATK
jgi:hypothetical protein